MARTSQQPGKTQTLNFYNIDEQLIFVDVPGYGYAKVSKTQREKFGKMIEEYITKRENLQLVIQLVDLRHDPTQDDILMYEAAHEKRRIHSHGNMFFQYAPFILSVGV